MFEDSFYGSQDDYEVCPYCSGYLPYCDCTEDEKEIRELRQEMSIKEQILFTIFDKKTK